MFPLASSTLATPNYSAIAISAIVSIAVFWAGYGLNRAATRRERQRKVIEDWLRELASWVDKFSDPSSKPDYNYNILTSRHVIELSLQRKHRYLAWWMHEMVVAIMRRRRAASESIALRQTCSRDLNELLGETGEQLLRWHHKELRSVDFHFPYQLRVKARRLRVPPEKYAHSINLFFYLTPIRMNIYRQLEFLRLLLDPVQGRKTIGALEQFVNRRYIKTTIAISIFIQGAIRIRLFRSTMRRNRLQRKINRLEGRADLDEGRPVRRQGLRHLLAELLLRLG